MMLQHSNSDKIVYNANAKKLKTFRKLEGLSQNQFAEKYEIPFNTYVKWEQGARRCPAYVIKMLSIIHKYDIKIGKGE
jgi:DNA-binding transcriptional regulator YiaG